MANFQENFQGVKGHTPCPLSFLHFDSQQISFQCPNVKSEVEINGTYEDIFTDTVPMEVFVTISNIMSFREK